jgi:anaphase-promoting complex subunit 1
MASVISLGLHQPTGLQYAIQEHLLPADPSSTSYDWHNQFDVEFDSILDEDELLVTPRSVIWSRGGVFRKCYKFDLEKEQVSQALLTSFPSVGPLETRALKEGSKNGPPKRSAAIVVFLKTQAHVYFLSGTSHVIHLPFEVELAIAAPNGIIIQRKLRVDNLIAASLKFPKVPPNSFVTSQPPPWSASSSQLSNFSVADFEAPKTMSLHFNSTLKDLWDPPALKEDAKWPRLFSLSDPLSELGLLAAHPSKSDMKRHRRGSIKLATLGISEEILHISPRGAFDQGGEHPLVLALTLNRETSVYTVWKMAYISEDTMSEKRRVPSDQGRRRSSFMPGTATGATTPVMNNQATFRDSFGGQNLAPGGKAGTKQAEGGKEKTVDFVSALDTEWNGSSTVTRRKSRRVSSMLARADLSANHERSAFNELGGGQQHSSNRRGDSLGSQYGLGRTSIGAYAGASGPNLSQPPQFGQSLNSLLEAPIDDLLDELRAGGDFEGFHNMGLDDDEFDSLRQEVILTKVCSVNAEHSNVRYSSQQIPAKSQCKVFMLTAPMSAADEQHGNSIVICILDSDEHKLVVLTLHRKIHASVNHESSIHGKKREKDVNVLSLAPIVRASDVLDACRLDDGQISRILVLTKTPDGYGELSLQAPWSILMKIPLPGKFAVSNIRDLGHDATPRRQREGGFKRVLSQGPRALRGLRNAKPHGNVDLVDDEGKLHQLQIRLEPQNSHVRKALNVCRAVLPGHGGGESVVVAWWKVMQWLRLESIETVDSEWSALVITLFSLFLSLSMDGRQSRNNTHKKKKSRGHLRSSSGAHSDTESWQEMLTHKNQAMVILFQTG